MAQSVVPLWGNLHRLFVREPQEFPEDPPRLVASCPTCGCIPGECAECDGVFVVDWDEGTVRGEDDDG